MSQAELIAIDKWLLGLRW